MHRFGEDLKLLVATDLTPRSDRAVDRAIALAGEWKAPLTVVHVVSEDLPRSLLRSRIEEPEQLLETQVGAWRERQLDVTRVVAKGHDYEAIIEQARNTDAKFIIMGTHRKVLMREYWLGTTVDKVVRFGDRPVLIVRQKPLRPYQKVLVTVDFSPPSRLALEFALLLFPSAEITVLHALQVPFHAFQPSRQTAREFAILHENEMRSLIDAVTGDFRSCHGEPGNEIKSILDEGSPIHIVHRHVKKLKPDIVVIGTHGRTGIRKAVIGSIAEDLISSLPTDVLAVRPQRA